MSSAAAFGSAFRAGLAALTILAAGAEARAIAASIVYFEGEPIALSPDGGTFLREPPIPRAGAGPIDPIATRRARLLAGSGAVVDAGDEGARERSRLPFGFTATGEPIRGSASSYGGRSLGTIVETVSLRAGTAPELARVLSRSSGTSRAYDLSAGGHVVVGAIRPHGSTEAFRWTPALGFEPLPSGLEGDVGLCEVSPSGQLAAGTWISGDPDDRRSAPVAWSPAHGFVPLSAAMTHTVADRLVGVADGAVVVARRSMDAVAIDYLRADGSLARQASFPAPAGEALVPQAVASDGGALFGAWSPEPEPPVFDPVFGSYTSPPPSTQALFRWSESRGLERIALEVAAPGESEVSAVDRLGRVAVGTHVTSSTLLPSADDDRGWRAFSRGSRAFIWHDGQDSAVSLEVLLAAMGLDLGGVTLDAAVDVSADGRKVLGRTGDGRVFLATIPEPTGAVLLGLGLLGLASVRARG